MSGENIYNVLQEGAPVTTGPYTGNYEKHFKERPKPAYSTFFEKGKEYDGSHVRYFKQRHAVFGPVIGDTVDPKNFLRSGRGVKHSVPPVQQRKIFTKPLLDHGISKSRNQGRERVAAKPNILSAGEEADELRDANGLEGGYGRIGEKNGVLATKESGAQSGEEILEDQGNIDWKHYNGPTGYMKESGNGQHGNEEKDFAAHGANIDQSLHSANAGGYLGGKDLVDGKKDFATSNIIQVSNMVPKRRKDQPENPTSRKTFGQAPGYLHRVKREIDEEKRRLKSIEEMQLQQKIQNMKKFVHRLDKKEQLQLLEKLRKKLNEKSAELIKMPFLKDTYTQILRRAELEKGIKQIEASIAKLDKDAVFVYNDDPRCIHWTKNAALEEATLFASEREN
ncbi:putative prolyl oligopeptidase, putative,serine peptidase clan SC, family S9A [Trypanosoma cruzi]|uniref:Enkurin domain-containing protein n=2 Tax=Trypanosoma cruzi TaxID=5693 RepID=V5DS69_TRYCR|nr:hypothetical protein TCDM_01047 [Trypanosoma cruzi Dm28c]KAF8285394.1 hypothetical protein TcBrA4_0036900 [Trypanosoma cruzi]PBJ80344.1 Enkuring domain-containig protein [Trypanosoma cruzi cruzi]PWU95373.1 Enkuring domain-containig protein [Trypanosoma cruzi]RNF14419.1 putative prolyl oligopeptidase, putative,serine peptidase clan SC, family S9A [Trypanosoma cruzi]